MAFLHPGIKNVNGTSQAEAALVSFNLKSFESYGKKQNYNAPVSKVAAFAYTTVLNHLLRFESRQCIRIGDAIKKAPAILKEKTLRDEACKKWIDVRAFGQVFAFKGEGNKKGKKKEGEEEPNDK
ncbi:MAG: type I-C CRISPR-associated protein Cas8c/Csd1, partial [Syntrophales bacterium]|nr:type I-C CRISPR-associated protein Cas8c/Csd1 [Syntrophales bacterium]